MAATNKTTLKTYFETNDIPTQGQYADFIDSYPNVVDENQMVGLDNAVVPVFPASQGTAYQIAARYNYINSAGTATAAFILPVATVGRQITVGSNVSNSVTAYPASGEKFVPIATNGGYLMYNNEVVTFICQKAGEWTWISNAPENGNCFIYEVNLTQTSTNAPVATVVRNNMPTTVSWSYVSPGNYDVTCTGILINNRTIAKLSGGLASSGTAILLKTSAPNSYRLVSHDIGGSGANGLMTDYSFSLSVRRY